MVLGIALGLRHPVQDLERAVDVALIGPVGRLGERRGQTGRRGHAAAAERGEDRRVVERPLHGIARPHDDLRPRRLAGRGGRALAARQPQLALRVGRRDDPLEHDDRALVRRHLDEELGALDGGVEIGRVDRQQARAAAE